MKNLNCFAVVVPGLEKIVAEELKLLSAHELRVEEGGVSFQATMDGLFRINLRARTPTRILIRLAKFRALSFPELYNKSKKVEWSRFVGPDSEVVVKATCHGSKLMHSGRAERALFDAISDKLGVAVSGSAYTQQVLLRIENNDCTISIDASGERLDRRGYRLQSGKAPIRETIAAAVLQWMGWSSDKALLAPMCGSGTFAIEAALMAAKRAVGLQRDFAFLHWPACKQKRWQRAKDKAEAMQGDSKALIGASDLDAAILAQARRNAAAAGVSDHIEFAQLDVRSLAAPDGYESGLIICNPPYGHRISADVKKLYASLGSLFAQRFSGWDMAVIVPDQACENALGLTVKRRLKIKHGGNWVHVLHL